MTKEALINQIASNLPDNIVQAIEPKDMRDILNNIVTVAFDAQSYAAASFKGSATTTSDPGETPSPQFWFASEAGTYTSLGGLAVTSDDLASNLVLLSYDGTIWSKQLINVGVDLTNYYNKTGTDTAISSQLTSIIGSVLQDTLVVENFPESQCGFLYTTSTFSGWGSPIGNPQNFNAIKIKIRARATAITSVKFCVTTINKTGTVLAEKEVLTNIPASTDGYVTVVFDDIIENSSSGQLYLSYACNQQVDTFADNVDVMFPQSDYGAPSYAINGVQTFPFPGVSPSDVNFYTYISLRQTTISPDEDFSDKVADNSPKIQAIKEDADASVVTTDIVNKAIENIYAFGSDPVPNFSISSAAWNHATSTFSGWGSPIGTQQNFNAVKFKIRARSSNSVNITKIKCIITQGNKSGTILGQKEIDNLNIAPGVEQWITVMFDSTIVNADANILMFFFLCDTFVDLFSILNAISTPAPCYVTNGTMTTLPANFTDVTGTHPESIYIETGTMVSVPSPTNDFAAEIQKKLDIPGDVSLGDLVDVDIVLPSRIFAVTGTETNLYWKDFIYSNFPIEGLSIDITCNKGAQHKDFYRVTPVDADAGAYDFTINVYFDGTLLKSASSKLYISSANAANGVSRKVLCVGDSTTSPGTYIAIINTDHGSDVFDLTFIGTQGTAPNNHEGYGGWAISSFATAGVAFYKFDVTDIVTPPAILSIYTDGTNQFTVREINITEGNGYFSAQRTAGSGVPSGSGILTNVSGEGDTTINFTSVETVPGNPFWDATNSKLDFAGYLADHGFTMASGDWVIIHLGINDVFGYTDDDSVISSLDGKMINLRNIISNMRSAVSGLRVGICVTIPPSSQDGFAYNYTTGQTLYRYMRNLKFLQQRYISEFDNDTDRATGNYLIPWNAILDRVNNMQKTLHTVNARNTDDKVTMNTNGVHPAPSGYYQMGDQLWCFLKYMA